MKTLFTIMMMAVSIASFAQSSNNDHNVCLNEVVKEYPTCTVTAENKVIVGNKEVYKITCDTTSVFHSFAQVSLSNNCLHDGLKELNEKLEYSKIMDELND